MPAVVWQALGGDEIRSVRKLITQSESAFSPSCSDARNAEHIYAAAAAEGIGCYLLGGV